MKLLSEDALREITNIIYEVCVEQKVSKDFLLSLVSAYDRILKKFIFMASDGATREEIKKDFLEGYHVYLKLMDKSSEKSIHAPGLDNPEQSFSN